MLDIRQVARLLRVSVPTVYDLARSGQLTRVKIGACARYRQADVARYIDNLPTTPIGKPRRRPAKPLGVNVKFGKN